MPQLAIAQVLLQAAYAVGINLTVNAAMAVATVIQFVATTAASMAASKLLAPKMPSFSDPSLADRTQMVRSPIAARQIIYGTTRVSGVVVYMSTTGTKNEYLHLVIALAGHEVEEIGDVYFNDELAFSGSGLTPSATGRFAGVATISKNLGSDTQAADASLVSATSGLTNGKWTNNHRLRGIAYVYVRLTWSDQVWTGGIPSISAIVKGKKVYDPRTTTTAYTANAALCLRDYLTSATYGMGMAASEMDDTAFGVAANICDEQVEVKPVTSPATYENRYEANGVLYTSASPDENIGKLMSAMGGLVAYSGGKIIPYAAGYRIPTVTLTDSDFAGGITVQTRTSARDRVNAVKGVFVSSKSEWQPTDFPPLAPAAYLSADNGVRYWRDVTLPMTTSSSCAQRLARIELRRARQEVTVTARFKLDAMQVRAGDTVMLTLARYGWSSKVFEVMGWNFVSDGSPPQLAVEMTLRETASTVYDWSTSDEVEVPATPTTTLPDPFALDAPTNLTLTADGTTQLIQADGTAIPRIKVAWSAPSEEFIQSGGDVVIEYKQGNATTYLTWSRVDGDQTLDYISSDVRIGTSYDVRIYGLSYFQIATSYLTASVTVAKDTTAPNAPTSLTASVGTGKAVSLDWADNTEPDLSEYGIYRNTTGTTPASVTADKIAEVRASRFVDTEVAIGTTYYYWVNAYDLVENVSGFSNRATAVPVSVPIDTTAPDNPTAATVSTVSRGTYLASDGTAFAFNDVSLPALPSGGAYQQLYYRKTAVGGQYLIAGQFTNTSAVTVRIDDLSVGVTYDVATQAYSAYDVPSSIVAANGSPFLAATKTAQPSDVITTSITHYSGSSNEYNGPVIYFGTTWAFSARTVWDAVSDKDVVAYEYTTFVSPTIAPSLTYEGVIVSTPEAFTGSVALNPAYFWVRSIDRTGNKSNWVSDGTNLNGIWGHPAPDMVSQNSDDIDITGGDIVGVVLSALAAPLAVNDGGTGASTTAGALENLLPSYTSNAGKVLAVNGTADDVEWIAASGSGTVTYVNGTGTVDGITLSGTVTTAGDLTLSGNVDVTSVTGVLPIAHGGTGETSATDARGALLPSYSSNAGKILAVKGDESDVEWSAAGTGTVTSVAGTGSVDGLSLSGTVTTAGSLTLSGNIDVSSVTGTLPVAQGGTGANDAGTARTNLGLGTAATKDTTNMGNLKTGVITILTNSYLSFESGSTPKIDEGWGLSLEGDSTHPVRVQEALVLGSFGAGNTFTVGRIYFSATSYIFEDSTASPPTLNYFDGSTTYQIS